jgi:uncharacterized protein involved in response to NO
MIRPAFFSIGFRPFFASGILFAALALLLWSGFWQLSLDSSLLSHLSPFGGLLFWHPHELIMGFALAIIMGFLLTAVRNWTGLETAPPVAIFIIWCSWLLARFAMLWSEGFPFFGLLSIQMAPAILAAFFIGKPIIKKRLWRNLFAPAALLLFALLDGCMLLAMRASQEIPTELFYTSVLLIIFVITMIGGRVIPFFTANKLKVEKANEPKFVFLLTVIPLLIMIVLQLVARNEISQVLMQTCAALLFAANATRLFIWHQKAMWREPMLWSLWLFYAALPLGYLFMIVPDSLIQLGSIPIHIMAIGGICGLIISMVSRVSLGHTGRVITHDGYIVSAFVLMLTALVMRTGVVFLLGLQTKLIIISAYLAAASLLIIFFRFIYIWATPRPDAK